MKKKLLIIFALIVCVVLLGTATVIGGKQLEIPKDVREFYKDTDTKELIKQIEKVDDVIDEMTVRLSAPVTDEYIEKVVRDQLGYYCEGEIIFYNDLAN